MRDYFDLRRFAIVLALASCLSQVAAAVPGTPANVRSSWLWSPVPSGAEILLTWDAVPEATSYHVYLWDDASQVWTVAAAGLTDPRYRTLAPPPTPARYVISAANTEGEGAPSAEALVLDGPHDNYITVNWPGLYPGTLTDTNAWISWFVSHVSGAEGMVETSTNGNDYLMVYHQTNYQSGHGVWMTNLTPLTLYWYRLTTIGTNRVGYSYVNYFGTMDSNYPPVAESLNLETYMGYPLDVQLHGWDNGSQVPDQIESFRIIQGPTNGTLSGTFFTTWNNLANVLYTPAQNRPVVDHFWYVANDGDLDSAPALVAITNVYYNTLPQGAYTNYTTTVGVAIPIALAGYDSDGDPITFALDTNYASVGVVTGPLESLVYTPPPGFAGQDYVLYRVSDDGMATWISGMVVIDVLSTNVAPVAFGQSVTVSEDSPQTIILVGQDANGDVLNYVITTPPAHGSLSGIGHLLSYLPNQNYSGPDSFVFLVNDGQANSATATVNITVTPLNDAPVAVSSAVTTWEDTAININLQASDVEGSPLTYWLAPTTNGSLSGSGATRTFFPAANWNGTNLLQFRAHDGFAWSELATVTVLVMPVNDLPQFVAQSLTTPEDTPKAFAPIVIEPDGEAYSISLVSGPTNGWLEVVAPGYVYHPNANATGADRVVFSVTETNNPNGVQIGPPETVYGVITFNVTPINDGPVAYAQSVSLAEDGSKLITLTGSDVDNYVLAYSIVSLPSHGSLSGAFTNYTYTPAANYHGPDSFTFRIFDGSAYSAPATVSISVTPVNDPPTATGGSYSLPEDGVLIFGTVASDIDGDPLTYSISTPPAHGTLTPYGTSGNNWTYRPSLDWNGPDSFTFMANDGTVNSGAATVSFTITPVNDMPWITNQTVETAEDTAINITPLTGDVDGNALTFTLFTPPSHGSVTVNGGQLTYTPSAHFHGQDSFEYQSHDPHGGSNTGLIIVSVTSVNDAPVATAQAVTVSEDVTSSTIVLAGSDVDGDTLTYLIVTAPGNGTLSGTLPNFVYTPNANFHGTDSFTFRVNDGTLSSPSATVELTVTPVNDAPSAQSQSRTTAYNTPLSVTLTGSDIEGNALTYTLLSNPANGTLSGTAPNLTFTPTIGFSGTTSFTFRANDGSLNSGTATVTITVSAATAAPAAPGALTASAISTSQINLTWSDNSNNEDGFKIERSTNGSTWSQIATVGPGVASYASTGLAANKTYYYRVRAHNVVGNSAYSATVSAKTFK